jgi:hypothetical protein
VSAERLQGYHVGGLRTAGLSGGRETGLQGLPDGRSVGPDDAVIDRVADPSGGYDHVLRKDAVPPSADSLDGPLRPFVQPVGLELHAKRGEVIESMAEEKVLPFGVRSSALVLGRESGPSDLQVTMLGPDGEEPRGADCRPGLAEHRREREVPSRIVVASPRGSPTAFRRE